MEDVDIYRHAPLESKRSIRLVELLPYKKDRHEPISSLNMIQCSLDDHPRYEALSYAWDAPKPDTAIPCTGKHVLVTANCEAALKRLRRKKRNRLVWIDAICIDQDAILERNHQVSIMGEIYMKAVCTLVWLGPGTPGSDWALKYLRLTRIFQPQGYSLPKLLKLSLRRLLVSLYKVSYHQIGKPGRSIDGIRLNAQDLQKRAYWSRIWTLQEVGLSRHAKVYCGFAKPVPLQQFWLLASLFNSWAWSDNVHFHLYLTGVGVRIMEAREIGRFFHDVLRKVSSDPRDKVFALRALFPLALEHLAVDYERPVEAIYVDATRLIIEHEKSLDLLCYTYLSSDYLTLPSWAPDWNTAATYQNDFMYIHFRRSFASRHSQINVSFSKEAGEISVSGKIISYVDWIGDQVPIVNTALRSDSQVEESTVPQARSSPSSLLLGWLSIARTEAQSRRRDMLEVFENFIYGKHSDYLELLVDTCMIFGGEAQAAGLDSIESSSVIDVYISYHLGGKTAFTTSTGQIGMSFSPKIEPEDAIASFSGLNLPMIIRAKGDAYVVVGPAVISGMMKGQQWPDDEKELQDIVLV